MEAGRLSEQDLTDIANFIVDNLRPTKDKFGIGKFLNDAAAKWKFLEGIKLTEESELKDAVEDEVFDGVITLAKHGKVEEAIRLAKSATSK